MKAISFGSVYVIPRTERQNKENKEYKAFLEDVDFCREKSQKATYDKVKNVYYLPIKDSRDQIFENYAKMNGISYQRACKLNPESPVTSPIMKTPANAELSFIGKAVKIGAKYTIKYRNGIQRLTFFNDDGKTVFAKYDIDTKNGKKLLKKISYMDGKPNSITEYDDSGKFKKVIILDDKGRTKFVFNPKLMIK